jgi:hypothetical protein
MDSMDNFRERFEALEQRTEQRQQHPRMIERRLRWWRGIACGVMLLGLASLPLQSGKAADTQPGGMADRRADMEALTLDQSFTSPSDLGADINDCCRFVAQTFTAGLTGTLGGVNIDVSSPTNSIFPLHVAIRTVVDSVPSTKVLGETILSSSSAPLSLLITFPQVIHITAGVQYAIVVNYEGAPPPSPANFQGIWGGAGGNQYTGGALYFSFLDGISWFGGEADVHFQTYVNVEPCTLTVEASSPDGTLNLAFEVGTREPATWNTWLTSQTEIARLFSVPLPVIEPPIPVSLTLPFFPALGTIGVLTTLTTPDKGIICAVFTTVDTGPPTAASVALKELMEPHAGEMHDQLRQQHIR